MLDLTDTPVTETERRILAQLVRHRHSAWALRDILCDMPEEEACLHLADTLDILLHRGAIFAMDLRGGERRYFPAPSGAGERRRLRPAASDRRPHRPRRRAVGSRRPARLVPARHRHARLRDLRPALARLRRRCANHRPASSKQRHPRLPLPRRPQTRHRQ